MTDLETRYVGRFEWEQVLRRMRKTGLIGGSGKLGKTGRQTKGGVSASLFTSIALTLATYGTLDGSEIYPGDAAIAVDVECSLKTVRAVKGKLTELGMLKHVRTARARRGEEWRLTLPEEFPASVEILTPAQHKIAAKRIRDDARGKTGGSGGPPRDESEEPTAGGPADPPLYENDLPPGGSGGPTKTVSGGSGGPASGGSGGPAYQTTDPATTDQAISDADLRTVSHPPREGAAEPNSELPSADVIDLESRRTALAPSKCRHGLKGGNRASDGQPHCALCRKMPAADASIPEPRGAPA